jgi:lipid II:glycine glycyltransferase (peptidoglycan interpeptide bridge formation enzyme)
MSARDEYVAAMKQRLDELNAEMAVLEAKAHQTKENAKENYQEQLSALHAKRLEGEKQLEAIKAATEESWMQLKAGTDTVWGAFKDSVHQFKSHFN